MANLILSALGCVVLVATGLRLAAWRRNYLVARASGLPVFIAPVQFTDIWWLMIQPMLVPLLNLLPSSWTNPWLPLTQPWEFWRVGHTPFAKAGSNTFVLASPTGNILWTADNSAVRDLFNQPGKANAAIEMLEFFNIWGPAFNTVEGEEWKVHRKAVAGAFHPTTNAAVWKETLHQTDSMVNQWIKEGSVIPVVKRWTSRLALHVFSGVMYERSLGWTGYTQGSEPTPPGRQLSFESALFTILERLGTLYLTPRFLLNKLPGKLFREASVGFSEWTKYMEEMRTETSKRIEAEGVQKEMTMLESLVLANTPNRKRKGDQPLSDESVLGNMFMTLIAGHETVGNALAFALLLLAIYPEYQRQLQEELDQRLGVRSRAEWSEKDASVLQQGFTGAIQNEVLLQYCVVQFLVRKAVAPVTIRDSAGRQYVVPVNTLCVLDFAAAFQNPAIWAPKNNISSERRAALHNSPALNFDPSRWLDQGFDFEEKDTDVPTFWPFGQGPRKCVGRAFAQVEMTAALATIFKNHSLELVVSDTVLTACNGDKARAWETTRDEAMRTMIDDVGANITLQMVNELPIRLVKRTV